MIDLPVVQTMQGGLSESLPVEGELAPLFAEILAFVTSIPGPELDGLDQPTVPLPQQSGGNQSPVDFEQAVPPAPLMFIPTATDTVEQKTEPNVEAQVLMLNTTPDLQAKEGSDGELPGIPQAPAEQTVATPVSVASATASDLGMPAPEVEIPVDTTTIGRPESVIAAPVEIVTDPLPSMAVAEPPTLPSSVSARVVPPQAPEIAQPTAPILSSPLAQEAVAGPSGLPQPGEAEKLPIPAAGRVDDVSETSEASTSTAPSLNGSPGSGRIERPDPPALVQRIDRWLSTRPTTPNTLILEFGESGNFRVTVALRTAGLQITVAGAGTEDIPWIQELSATLESRGLDAEVSSDAESGQQNDSDSQDEQPNWNPPPLKQQPASEQGLRL